MKKRLLTSKCERAWLFDVEIEARHIRAGLACVLPGNDIAVDFEVGEQVLTAVIPNSAAHSPCATKIINARLTLLETSNNEQIFRPVPA